MSTSPTATALSDLHLFEGLKVQILGLATALYGTRSSSQSQSFDLLSYTTTTTTTTTTVTNEDTSAQHGVALIVYTGAPVSPFTTWELLSYVDNQASMHAGAEKILENLRLAMGCVIGNMESRGNWAVRHARIPDIADLGSNGRTERLTKNVSQRWSQTLEDIGEEDEGDEKWSTSQ